MDIPWITKLRNTRGTLRPGAICVAGAESPVPGAGHLLPTAPVEGGS